MVPNLDISALKPYFGHNLGGNIILELVALMMMFRNNCILPTLNISGDNLICNLKIVRKYKNKKISLALKSTCAFAGFYAALVFKKIEENNA